MNRVFNLDKKKLYQKCHGLVPVFIVKETFRITLRIIKTPNNDKYVELKEIAYRSLVIIYTILFILLLGRASSDVHESITSQSWL